MWGPGAIYVVRRPAACLEECGLAAHAGIEAPRVPQCLHQLGMLQEGPGKPLLQEAGYPRAQVANSQARLTCTLASVMPGTCDCRGWQVQCEMQRAGTQGRTAVKLSEYAASACYADTAQYSQAVSCQSSDRPQPPDLGVSARVQSGNLVWGGKSQRVHSKQGVYPGRMTLAWPLKPSVPPSTKGLMVLISKVPSCSYPAGCRGPHQGVPMWRL